MKTSILLYRWMFYGIIAGLTPLAFVFAYLLSENSRLTRLEQHIESVKFTALQQERKQSQNLAVRHHFRDADHFYIDKNLESLRFLEDEIESLHKIASNSNIGQIDSVAKRIAFLTGASNSLQFSEGVVQAYPYFQETMETLTHPVEVGVEDIRKILAKTEGVQIGAHTPSPNRPQLIITDFKIDKKQIREGSDVYSLQMKVLKREFL